MPDHYLHNIKLDNGNTLVVYDEVYGRSHVLEEDTYLEFPIDGDKADPVSFSLNIDAGEIDMNTGKDYLTFNKSEIDDLLKFLSDCKRLIEE